MTELARLTTPTLAKNNITAPGDDAGGKGNSVTLNAISVVPDFVDELCNKLMEEDQLRGGRVTLNPVMVSSSSADSTDMFRDTETAKSIMARKFELDRRIEDSNLIAEELAFQEEEKLENVARRTRFNNFREHFGDDEILLGYFKKLPTAKQISFECEYFRAIPPIQLDELDKNLSENVVFEELSSSAHGNYREFICDSNNFPLPLALRRAELHKLVGQKLDLVLGDDAHCFGERIVRCIRLNPKLKSFVDKQTSLCRNTWYQ